MDESTSGLLKDKPWLFYGLAMACLLLFLGSASFCYKASDILLQRADELTPQEIFEGAVMAPMPAGISNIQGEGVFSVDDWMYVKFEVTSAAWAQIVAHYGLVQSISNQSTKDWPFQFAQINYAQADYYLNDSETKQPSAKHPLGRVREFYRDPATGEVIMLHIEY